MRRRLRALARWLFPPEPAPIAPRPRRPYVEPEDTEDVVAARERRQEIRERTQTLRRRQEELRRDRVLIRRMADAVRATGRRIADDEFPLASAPAPDPWRRP